MKIEQAVVLDTSILTALHQQQHARHQLVEDRVFDLIDAGIPICVPPQSLYEFHVVATRPVTANGLGAALPAVKEQIDDWLQIFTLLPDIPAIFKNWYTLVHQYGVSGKTAHDTRMVAWMLAHSIPQLYTLNVQDFLRYRSHIQLLES